MKTAISVPVDLFTDAERLAKLLEKSRSRFHCHAVREYVARHAPDTVTQTLDEVSADVGEEDDEPGDADVRLLRGHR